MTTKTKRPTITGYDLMDSSEVAEAFGVSQSSLNVAMSKPDVFPALADRLPAPIRKIGKSWVWLRVDIEAAVAE